VESRLSRFLDKAGISQADVAAALSVDPSSISKKISSERPWKLDEIRALLALLAQRTDRAVTYEEVFGLVGRARGKGRAA
jgi:transcriptional regulator with XRE-family HTH domain